MIVATMTALTLVSASAIGQASPTTKSTKKPVRKAVPAVHKESIAERQIRELREAMQAQQAQIDAMKQQLAARDAQVQAAQQSVSTAQAQAASAAQSASDATAAAAAASAKADTLSTSVTDLKATNVGLQETVIANQARIEDEINSPTVLHYKGVTITPVAFFALEGVFRNRSLNSDINTPFNSIPFPGAIEGHVSELNFSGRQSRLGGLFEGNAGKYKLSGYFEADFLGTGTSSNNNQSNSYVQQRFGDVKSGMFTAAMSLEQAQITSFTANGTNPADYFFGGAGQNGGLYNAAAGANTGNNTTNTGTTGLNGAITTYANNVAPDVIVKGALDFRHAHFELGGLGRFFRDYYNPVTTSGSGGTPVYTYNTTVQLSHTSPGGGIFGSARATSKYLDVAVQAMGGQGVGRYGSSQLADVTLRPDETLEPIRNYHGMFSLESHPAPKLDVYAYYGGEYAQRTVYTTAAGNLIGYAPRNLNDAGCYGQPPAPAGSNGSGGAIASPSTCASPTRYIQEGMIGFTYRLASSPRYGRLQYQMTYSYLQRTLWSGTTFGPRALDNMVHAGMRYYIP